MIYPIEKLIWAYDFDWEDGDFKETIKRLAGITKFYRSEDEVINSDLEWEAENDEDEEDGFSSTSHIWLFRLKDAEYDDHDRHGYYPWKSEYYTDSNGDTFITHPVDGYRDESGVIQAAIEDCFGSMNYLESNLGVYGDTQEIRLVDSR